MKALEKDRAGRYETANAFGLDVQRYLDGEPVAAHPPSRAYRLRKFLRKHRGPVVAAGLLFLAQACGVVGTSLGLVEARTQRDLADEARRDEAAERGRAEKEARRATEREAETRAALDFVEQRVFAAARPVGGEVGPPLPGYQPRGGALPQRRLPGGHPESGEGVALSGPANPDNSSRAFFLAMAHCRLGDQAKAREWFDKGERWLEKAHWDKSDMKRDHDEAAELLGSGMKP